MHPLNRDGADVWRERSIEEIRDALKRKTVISMKKAAVGGKDRKKGRSRVGTGLGVEMGTGYERVRTSGREVV